MVSGGDGSGTYLYVTGWAREQYNQRGVLVTDIGLVSPDLSSVISLILMVMTEHFAEWAAEVLLGAS